MRAALLALLGTAACSIPDGEYFGRIPEPDPTHFRWCNSAEPEYLDPGLANSTADLRVIYELFDGLTTYDENASPKPSVATSWEISPDQRRFTFHLRRDARWSNGRPFTAHDFTYSIARVLHPLTASQNAENLWRLRHGKPYSSGIARLVLRDAPPFRAGEVVAVDDAAPPTNRRVARVATPLRAAPDAAAATWAVAPPGGELTIIELDATRGWGYLHLAGGDGVFGWAPLAGLDAPNDARRYAVSALDGDTTRRGELAGRDLLHLPEILGARAPDDHTLVLETEGPVPIMLDLTLTRGLRPVPREVVSRWPKRWVRPEHIVTSGPFHLAEWRERDKFELRRSPTFWDAARVRLERVTIYSMSEQSANVNVYYQGGCDALVANSLPPSMLPVISGEAAGRPPRKDYVRASYLGIYYYTVNVERFPNVHLRRALSHALDRTMLPLLLKGGQLPAEGFTPGQAIATLDDDELALCGVTRDTPGVAMIVETGKLCYVPPLGPRSDPEAARRELELARRELGAAFPTVITVRFNSGFEQHKTIAEWAQHEWERVLGLRIELESQEWKTFLKATRDGDYDVARMAWIGSFNDPESEFLSIFKCDSPDNRSRWCNREFERLLDAAAAEPDRARRLALVRDAEALMIADVPVIAMYVYTQHVLTKPYVRDLYINLSDKQSLRETWIDPQWRTRR